MACKLSGTPLSIKSSFNEWCWHGSDFQPGPPQVQIQWPGDASETLSIRLADAWEGRDDQVRRARLGRHGLPRGRPA
eukprot:5700643-Pyramimonas_sp.AAC.1